VKIRELSPEEQDDLFEIVRVTALSAYEAGTKHGDTFPNHEPKIAAGFFADMLVGGMRESIRRAEKTPA
jgi:hypothetical protein